MEPGIIKKLDEVVVNKIAAGEVIQRPANALKELIENCLDAKATHIEVTIKCGGMKMLQILDNGTGIRKEDLPIVCERFTTSKLERFYDLPTIATYGFRGEALSSISHVAHLKIQTKTRGSQCAYKAQYENGALKGPPTACAGNQGTVITVEDMFYNVPTRRSTLRTPNDEYQLIYGVVSKYAIHNPHVGFILRKFGENPAMRTTPDSQLIDNIRVIYGNSVASELIPLEFTDATLKFSTRAFISNGSHAMKKGIFLFFINNRLVDCEALKVAISELYTTFLPPGMHPFIYMSLNVEPLSLDVNVHPTKHEVHFLHEDTIIERIIRKIEEKLLEGKSFKTFYTELRLPTKARETKGEKEEPKIVRTDTKEVKIEKFLMTASQQQIKSTPEAEIPRKVTKLTSILTLRKSIEDGCSREVRKIIRESSFVGAVDREQFLIQCEDKMYLCDTQKLMQELFYQIFLYDFENFGKIELESPLDLQELAHIALDSDESGWTDEDGDKDELVQRIVEILCDKSPIMREYYNLSINKEEHVLETLPLILPGFTPPLSHLPMFLLRLATEVEWDTEMDCFRTLTNELARFYAGIEFCPIEEDVYATLEHIVYPAMKEYLIPPEAFASNGAFLEVAALPELHKVFERC